ncbi:MAG TPA: histidine phosphatase family protein [Candidatus Dormibacteraeota bacterium]|nr:histidine phosphatase family protein [Candidatus Dormibacteraeota bacterium]
MLVVAAGSEQLTRAMESLEAAFLIGVEGVTEIWLVRHADCYQDLTITEDPPLSALGRQQAARLAERVRRVRHAAVYSSPYRRAIETAHAITSDVRQDSRLVEMELEVGEDGAFNFIEDTDAVIARMRAVVDEIAAEHASHRVVVVSHAAAIVAYLADALKLDSGRLRALPYFTSVSIVRVLGDRRAVSTFGDVAHLE